MGLLLALLLGFTINARAENEISIAVSCPSPAQIDPYILMCGHNPYVALQARYCADELVASWTKAAQELVPRLQARGQSGMQHQSEDDTRKDYHDAIRAISFQIKQMQYYTALIADYPFVMIDVGGSTGDETSLSCFNEAFHQVQDIVTYLDGEIVRAKKIKKSATALMELSASRHQNLAGSLGGGPVGGPAGKGGIEGSYQNSASTITGEINNVFLSSKAAAQQLAGRMPSVAAPPFIGQSPSKGERAEILATFSNKFGLYKKTAEQIAASKQVSSRKFKGGVPPAPKSVGSTLWQDGGGSFEMAVKPAPEENSRQADGGASSNTDSSATAAPQQQGSPPSFEPAQAWSPQQEGRGPASRLSSSAIAPSESNIFQLVKRRYRGTEQFRQSRPSPKHVK